MRIGASSREAAGTAFRSLSNRNFRLFWFGQLVSLAGTWMQDVALSWLVLSLTESPVALGLTMTIRFFPALVFSVFGGVLADRLPKRNTMVAAQLVQLAVALALAILTSTDLVTVALIYILAGLRGLVDAIETPTRQSFVPEMVGAANVSNAIALNSTLFNAARVVGPAIGAVVIGTLGMAACFYINAVSFLAVIIALLAMRESELQSAPTASGQKLLGELADGFRYARSTPEVLLILIVVGALGTFGYNFTVLLPLVAKYLAHSGVSGLAMLTTSLGIGAVVGGLIAAYRGKPGRGLMFAAAACFSVLQFGLGLSNSQAVSTGLMFAIGLSGVLFMTSANARLQLMVPENMRGRVIGMYILLFLGTTPISSVIIGQLAERVGVQETVLTMGAICLAGVLAGFAYAWRVVPAPGDVIRPATIAVAAEARTRERSEVLDGTPSV
ncbi:MAG TPA: MFS transporter [Thermoleophilia bacterium]|nr:MFS transporter [Thermoleophilia bacterium]